MRGNLVRGAVLGVLVAAVATMTASRAAAADGKELFLAQKCSTCHSIAAAGITATTKSEKMKGPALDGVVAEKGVEWTLKFLHKEVELEGKKHGKDVSKMSADDLKVLVDWLATQKKS
jgi:mono/diheme cytochrome c family protein